MGVLQQRRPYSMKVSGRCWLPLSSGVVTLCECVSYVVATWSSVSSKHTPTYVWDANTQTHSCRHGCFSAECGHQNRRRFHMRLRNHGAVHTSHVSRAQQPQVASGWCWTARPSRILTARSTSALRGPLHQCFSLRPLHAQHRFQP